MYTIYRSQPRNSLDANISNTQLYEKRNSGDFKDLVTHTTQLALSTILMTEIPQAFFPLCSDSGKCPLTPEGR